MDFPLQAYHLQNDRNTPTLEQKIYKWKNETLRYMYHLKDKM